MIGFENRELHTPRLTIRLAVEQDKSALWALLQDPVVTRPAGFDPILTAEEFDLFFSGLTEYRTGLAILAGNDLIGYVRVNKEELDQPELADKRLVSLGFVIGKPYQNRGYGTEMLGAMTAYLKERFDYCVADHFANNLPSQRIIEKCGYRFLEEYTWPFEHLEGQEKLLRSYIF